MKIQIAEERGIIRVEEQPAGRIILRIGAVCNGRRNHPASRNGRGLEVDKLSASAMEHHFSSYSARLCDALGVTRETVGPFGFNTMHIDSYEVGGQNWTQGLAEIFEKRMGYSLVPFLPVFTTRMWHVTLPSCSINTPMSCCRSSHVASGCAATVIAMMASNAMVKACLTYFLGMTVPSMRSVVVRSLPLVLIFTVFLKAPGRPIGL